MRPSSFSSATPRFYGRGERRGVGGRGGREGDIFSFFSCNGGRTRRVEANKREQQQAKNIIISNNESKKREMFPNAGDSGGAAFATEGKGGGERFSARCRDAHHQGLRLGRDAAWRRHCSATARRIST